MLFNEKDLKSLVAGKSREEILGDGGILKGLIKSLSQRYFYRMCGWTKRVSRRYYRSFFSNQGSAMHSTPSAQQFKICGLEG